MAQGPAFGHSPWETVVNVLQASYTSPIARGSSMVSIVVGWPMFVFGEGQSKRALAGIVLPAKVFRGPDEATPTRRCLLNRFPLFTRPGATELAFCYIDSEFETSGPFAAHLRRYLPRFAELTSFDLVYMATASTRLGQAQTVFERVLSRGRKWLTKVADPERLLAHFRDRKLFEKRETSDFDRLRLDAWPDDRHCFSGRHSARMFTRWETSGDEAIRAEITAQKMPNGRFTSCILPQDYDLFGRTEATS